MTCNFLFYKLKTSLLPRKGLAAVALLSYDTNKPLNVEYKGLHAGLLTAECRLRSFIIVGSTDYHLCWKLFYTGQHVVFLRHPIPVITDIRNLSDSYWKSETTFKMRWVIGFVAPPASWKSASCVVFFSHGKQFGALVIISLSEKNLNLGLDRLFSQAKLGCELGN